MTTDREAPASSSNASEAANLVRLLLADPDNGSKFATSREEGVRDAVLLLSNAVLSELGLAPPQRVEPPRGLSRLPLAERLVAVQNYIESLHYNHTSKQHFNIRKNRSLCSILETAREIVRESLPIRCIEAVFLGLLLTTGWEDLLRVPVGFKTSVGRNVYRHIVLIVQDVRSGLFGALGISRRKELAFKPLQYPRLSDLIRDFLDSYGKWWHRVTKVRIGLPVEHNEYYAGPVCWRYCHVVLARLRWAEAAARIDTHASEMKQRLALWKLAGIKEASAGDPGGRKSTAKGGARRGPAAMWDGYASVDSASNSRPGSATPRGAAMNRDSPWGAAREADPSSPAAAEPSGRGDAGQGSPSNRGRPDGTPEQGTGGLGGGDGPGVPWAQTPDAMAESSASGRERVPELGREAEEDLDLAGVSVATPAPSLGPISADDSSGDSSEEEVGDDGLA